MTETQTRSLSERGITELSSGQRQLVFIAKVLAQQTELLLMDEPLSALDIRYQLHILDLVKKLTGQGKSVVAALHDLNLAARFCDRIVLLANGRVLCDGSPDVVLTQQNISDAYGVSAVIRPDTLLESITVTALCGI